MTAECPFCARKSPVYFRTRDLNRRISEELFDYYRCPGCGLIFLSPIPTDLGKYYPANYYYGTSPPSLSELAVAARKWEGYKIEIVRRFVPSGRLLEIGPGGGGFAYLAKDAGYATEVIEMDAGSCQYLRDVVGVGVRHSDDATSVLNGDTSGTYDVIALWHVIEHLSDPLAIIDAAVARLSPGGILVVAAPNPSSFQFRLLGRYWTHVDAPRHVMLIPLKTLLRRGAALGLKPVLVTTSDEGAIGWNRFGWEESLFMLTTRWRRNLLRKIGTGLTSVFAPVERGGLRGSAYTVVLQKDR